MGDGLEEKGIGVSSMSEVDLWALGLVWAGAQHKPNPYMPKYNTLDGLFLTFLPLEL